MQTERENVSSAHKLDGLGKIKEHAPRSEHSRRQGALHNVHETALLSGCCHGSFSIYLLVTYLSAILRTCHPSTSCSPQRATTHCLHTICVLCVSKANTPLCVSAVRLRGDGQHRSWGLWWGQGPRPIGSR